MERGVRSLDKLMQGQNPPTSILCSNDMTAIGVIHEASNGGMQIPRDLSVIGFDDNRLAQFMIPPLTTIQMSS
jgi:DNA-binding LacI/PurR family transcriptional regulator